MTAIDVLLQQLDPGLEPPSYAHPGDAGADLRSRESFELQPGERRLVGTGMAIALPVGYAAFVHPRSGLAAKHGISIVNAPGTVDAGYRGEPTYGAGCGRGLLTGPMYGSTIDGRPSETPGDPRRTICGVIITTSSV